MHKHPLSQLAATAAVFAFALTGCNKNAEVTAAKPVEAPPPVASAATTPASTPAADAPSTAAAPGAANVSDVDVTEHVKTALFQAESLKGAQIAVVTSKGDIRLTGTLDSQTQIDDAMRIARAAEGGHTIHDELTIKK